MRLITKKNFVHEGCGFPVIVDEVQLIDEGHDTVALIDLGKLQRKVAECLISKPTALTGCELRFLRLYCELTQQALAERVGITHAAISKHENAAGEPTGAHATTETILRLVLASCVPGLEITRESLVRFFHMRQRASKTTSEPIKVSEVSSLADSDWQQTGEPTCLSVKGSGKVTEKQANLSWNPVDSPGGPNGDSFHLAA